MNLEQAKRAFIDTWGRLGAEWGINRTMAQVHALLLASREPLSTDQIMAELTISRGNANMNLRALLDWGLIAKELRPGERKEFFRAEKDAWEMARIIATERRKRELDPLIRSLEGLLDLDENKKADKQEAAAFKQLLGDIIQVGRKGMATLDLVLKIDQSSFFKPLLRLVKR
ncbi:MAG: transcriptional regulator [Planctomycetia bacterium]|nr:transcriptional regulator [Planctomycetia bacterium]